MCHAARNPLLLGLQPLPGNAERHSFLVCCVNRAVDMELKLCKRWEMVTECFMYVMDVTVLCFFVCSLAINLGGLDG